MKAGPPVLRGSATSYYNADGLGSITSLANGLGTLTQSYTLDSFGKQTASSGSQVTPFQYTGREADGETGLYYYRARYYDPNAGRFLGGDPVGFFAGVNFYRYVSNRPTQFTDPFGESQKDIQRLVETMDLDVQEMIRKGIRNPGKGDDAADENNLEKTLYIITGGRLGKPYLSCNQQDQYLVFHKVGDLVGPKNLDDAWAITEVPGTPFCINGYCTHWVLRLTSSNRFGSAFLSGQPSEASRFLSTTRPSLVPVLL